MTHGGGGGGGGHHGGGGGHHGGGHHHSGGDLGTFTPVGGGSGRGGSRNSTVRWLFIAALLVLTIVMSIVQH
ncbi:hypothetical protein [Streptomyces sp. 8L]|uniref:hypothetical protein n=1 Tax=Streptomyces sp. 8L TaxID=2877242 RepID=UPI001CD7607C|nr:hypothetical protein [Streptomyces sp. 8L]MCA1221256.1 hypothetical protein [Streptomyces sp. 8L]